MAGVTLAAYLLPAGIGDASLAGLPPEAGLYACLFGGLVFWLFCSSRQTAVTVTSAISLLVGATLGEMSRRRSGPPGGARGLHGADGRGAGLRGVRRCAPAPIVNFFSETVLVGFKCGVALFLASTQLPKLFGFSGSHGDFWERMGHFLRGLGGTNPTSLALGVAALVLLLLGKGDPQEPSRRVVRGDRRHRRGADVSPRRARRGAARRGAPGPADAGAAAGQPRGRQRAPAAGHGLLRARGGGNHRDRPDVRREARLSPRRDPGIPGDRRRQPRGRSWGGLPVSGGMSQSLVNETAGARTPLSGLVAALITLVVVAFFTGLLRYLPQPVLAAVVLVAVTDSSRSRRSATSGASAGRSSRWPWRP